MTTSFGPDTSLPQHPMDYPTAKREARKLLGRDADVKQTTLPFFPIQVGVWRAGSFVLVGAGATFEAALDDARINLSRITTITPESK